MVSKGYTADLDGVVPRLPKVSFAFPVLNEERNLSRCIESIRNQDYPREMVEIIIADGGSSDRTIEIARGYGAKVLRNPDRLAEIGGVMAHREATGEIKVFFAADNVLPHAQWIRQMVRPFMEDAAIWGAYTHIVVAENDTSLNKYYSLLHLDPFTWYVYRDAGNPINFRRYYPVERSGTDWMVFKFTPADHPLLALAQGFCIREGFERRPEYESDDILPVIQMIEEHRDLAYVPASGILHYHLTGFRQYLRKFRWRISNSLEHQDAGFDRRYAYLSRERRARKYFFVLYGAVLLPPLIHSIFWALRDRRACWLWHGPASCGLAWLIVFEVIRRWRRGK